MTSPGSESDAAEAAKGLFETIQKGFEGGVGRKDQGQQSLHAPWKRRGIVVLLLLVALSLYDHWTLRREIETLRVVAVSAAAHAVVNSWSCGLSEHPTF